MKSAKTVPMLMFVLLLALAGCGDSETASIPSWQAPDAYEFTLKSACGERTLIGKFRVAVESGSVVEAEGLDDSGRAVFEHGMGDEVPTLSELLDEAAKAKEQGADVVEIQATDDGRPTEINIDWDINAIDDEACYQVTGYSAAN